MRRFVRLLLIAILGAALGVWPLSTVVHAASVVTSLADNGSPGTLRAVIAAASAGDTITFQSGLSGVITLNSVSGTLTLTQNLTIQGPGAGVIAVDGGCTANCGAGGTPSGGVTVFTVNNGVTATISGLTIQHGNAGSGNGGGINNSGTLTVTNSIVTGNSAGGGGGGIYSQGPLSVTGGMIGGPNPADGNQSGGSGGGVFLSSAIAVNTNFSLSGVTVSHNTANDPQTSGGGGGIRLELHNYLDTATITNSTISANTATDGPGGDGGDGGGISNYSVNDGAGNSSVTTITGSTISGNTCHDSGTSSDAVGGGIANFGGTLNLTNSTVSGNTATGANRADGGGIYNQDAMNVTGSTISGNTATNGSGGGVWSENGAAPVGITFTNSTIVGNTATSVVSGVGGLGGGVFTRGRLVLTYTTVARNTAATAGGGVTNGSNVRPLGTIIAANTGGDCSLLGSAAYLSQGYNLDDDGTCGLTMPTDRSHDATPGLATTLAANGSTGPLTLALLPGSNAIDHGGTSANGCPATDERGIARPSGAACDIGAFELASTPTQPPLPPPKPAGGTGGAVNPLPTPPRPSGSNAPGGPPAPLPLSRK